LPIKPVATPGRSIPKCEGPITNPGRQLLNFNVQEASSPGPSNVRPVQLIPRWNESRPTRAPFEARQAPNYNFNGAVRQTEFHTIPAFFGMDGTIHVISSFRADNRALFACRIFLPKSNGPEKRTGETHASDEDWCDPLSQVG